MQIALEVPNTKCSTLGGIILMEMLASLFKCSNETYSMSPFCSKLRTARDDSDWRNHEISRVGRKMEKIAYLTRSVTVGHPSTALMVMVVVVMVE